MLKSADAIFQTYDTSGPTAAYRTALVLRQHSARPITLEGKRPPYCLFLVEAGRNDPKQPNSLELRAYDTLDEATQEAIRWLGVARAVSADVVPMTVCTGVANVMRDTSLLSKYAPPS